MLPGDDAGSTQGCRGWILVAIRPPLGIRGISWRACTLTEGQNHAGDHELGGLHGSLVGLTASASTTITNAERYDGYGRTVAAVAITSSPVEPRRSVTC